MECLTAVWELKPDSPILFKLKFFLELEQSFNCYAGSSCESNKLLRIPWRRRCRSSAVHLFTVFVLCLFTYLRAQSSYKRTWTSRDRIIVGMALLWLTLFMQVLACGRAEWWNDVTAHTRLPYNKSSSDCYSGLARNQTTVVTTLLHHKDFAESRLARTLPNLLAQSAADVGFFHTGWNDYEIAALQNNLSYVTFITCVASGDWAARSFRPNESVQTGHHNAGYRSMCRWYSSRVSGSKYKLFA